MPTCAQAFAAVAAALTDADPADHAAVDLFYRETLMRYPPRARALISDFLVAQTEMPTESDLAELKATVALPAAQLPQLDMPRRPGRSLVEPKQKDRPSTPPRPIDALIGARLRMRRVGLKMSATDLAAQLKLTEPQIQQSETGAYPLSAATLHDAAQVLGVPVGYFFVGAAEAGYDGVRRGRLGFAQEPSEFAVHHDIAAGHHLSGFAEQQAAFERPAATPNPESIAPEQSELLRLYDSITNPAGRRRALALLSGLQSNTH